MSLILNRTSHEGKDGVLIITPEGDEIRLKVANIQNQTVTLKFDADMKVKILRSELEPIEDDRGNK